MYPLLHLKIPYSQQVVRIAITTKQNKGKRIRIDVIILEHSESYNERLRTAHVGRRRSRAARASAPSARPPPSAPFAFSPLLQYISISLHSPLSPSPLLHRPREIILRWQIVAPGLHGLHPPPPPARRETVSLTALRP